METEFNNTNSILAKRDKYISDIGKMPKWVIFDYLTLQGIKRELNFSSVDRKIEFIENNSIFGLRIALTDSRNNERIIEVC